MVDEEIKEEIRDLRGQLNRVDTAAFQLQAEYDRAADAGEDDAKITGLHRQLMKKLNEGTILSEKLNLLRSEGERERRVQTKLSNQSSLRRLFMSEATQEKVKKTTARDQGVPEQYLNEAGNFKIGMDARLKSDLIESITGGITEAEPGASLNVFDEAEARRLITVRNWDGFLERKEALLREKAVKKAERDKEREETARQRAAEKAEKDAAKAAEKAAKATEAGSSDAPKASGGKSGGKSSSKTDEARAQREAKAAAAGK